MPKHKPKKHKARNRKYIQYKCVREFRAKPHAENYFKKQVEIINSLKPIMAAAKRFKERCDKMNAE